jgi:hypothetical protein
MQFDSNCFVGNVKNPFPETETAEVPRGNLPDIVPANSWQALSAYKSVARACGITSHSEPEAVSKDITGASLSGTPFRGALQP